MKDVINEYTQDRLEKRTTTGNQKKYTQDRLEE